MSAEQEPKQTETDERENPHIQIPRAPVGDELRPPQATSPTHDSGDSGHRFIARTPPSADPGIQNNNKDEWESFMAEGGDSPTYPETTSNAARRQSSTHDNTTNPQHSPLTPVSFFSGLLHKVSSTFENTIEQAKREIVRRDLMTQAQDSFLELRASLPQTLRSQPASQPAHSPQRSVSSQPPPGHPASTNIPSAKKTGKYLRSLSDPNPTRELKSLRLNTTKDQRPLFITLNHRSLDLVVVTNQTIEAFGAMHRRKILDASLSIPPSDPASASDTPTPPQLPTNQASPNPPPSANESSAQGPLPRSGDRVAMCAAYLPSTEEIIVGCRDATLCLFSVQQGRMGASVRQSQPLGSPPTSLVLLSGKPSRVAVGCEDGRVLIVHTADLSNVYSFTTPEFCSTSPTSTLPNVPVSCLHPTRRSQNLSSGTSASTSLTDEPNSVLVGYQEGVVHVAEELSSDSHAPYVAHAGPVQGLIGIFDDTLLVSIGSNSDPSISVAEAATGRTLARRMLAYSPTCIASIPNAVRAAISSRIPCSPSENTFIVGGDEGQIEVYRILVLSTTPKIELSLIRSISERQRKSREIVHMVHDNADSMLYALSINGEIRMWKLGTADARCLSLPATIMGPCTFNEDNIADSLRIGFKLDDPKLSASDDIIAAQRVLASVLEEEIGLSEASKDTLVADFQFQQAEMQDSAIRAGKEFMRIRRRVQVKYARGFGLVPSDRNAPSSDGRYLSSMKKSASCELDFAHSMYTDHLGLVRQITLENLQVTLLDALLSARGESSKIEALRTSAVLLVDATVPSQQQF